MSDICLMSINKIDMVIDKGRYVKHQAWINFLLGVIWQKDIPTKFEQHKILGQNCIFIST